MTDPDVKVSGDATGGFIVEMHDGDRFHVETMMADNEDAARAEGLKRFHAPVATAEPDAHPES